MASVYTNDLRLEEIGSGEQSGTWGDTTNTNLELIAEAFAFGTEAITTNADTHATTIADGATDPGRAMFLKYTGTLDSACTITIGPNTVSKLWFIENGTSGSQNIIIKQGSGATITIPPGDTKAIYSNGAGSGGAMVDAFASLSVVDLKVQDDLTVTDDVAIGGLATIGETLAVTGVVTANAGVVVDNITIDGQEIDVSSGDFLLDVAGDIHLDADGDNIKLFFSGTQYLDIYKSGNNIALFQPISDGDILFQGNDGGSVVAALSLDMSAAGAATFNSTITAAGGASSFDNTANVLTLNGSLHTRLLIDTASTGGHEAGLTLESNGQKTNFTNSGSNTSIVNDTGNFTIDSVGDIILDSDGGDLILRDGGVEIAHLSNSSSDFKIESKVSNKDIIFRGNDNGSGVTALTLDMSLAGKAFFNDKVRSPFQHGFEVRGGTSNSLVRFTTTTGDGGTNTVQTYWNATYGSGMAGGCLGAYNRSNVYHAPSASASGSNQFAIYGVVGEDV